MVNFSTHIMRWSVPVLDLLLVFVIAAAAAGGAAAAGLQQSFPSMYAFGNSLTDTGNSLLYQISIDVDAPEGHLPYGETFFHYPTGRISNGRLAVDFLAQRVGVPKFLPPYLGLNDTQINHGKGPSLVNFAVGGATAQSVAYLNATYNISVFIPYSTDKQLQWFSTLPISKDKETLSKALIYFGEIGVNDYNRALENGFSVNNVIKKFVPNVLKIIQEALEFIIERGAKYLVVEGISPIGCTPFYTKLLFVNAQTNEYGCVEKLKRIAEVHDQLLKQLVRNLSGKYSKDVHIIFFDQLKASIEILKHPSHYGFTNTTDPCFDTLHERNLTKVKPCQDPQKYVSWDGLHFTEATNKALLNLFYTPQFATPYPNFLMPKSG